MDIKEMVRGYQDEMITNIRRLVKYESVQGNAEENYPFGKTVADCLHEALQICEENGFETKNLDNYCGYAQCGEGDKLIGVIGHLDVVPLGNGWKHDPLGGEIEDGIMYGRGTSDDKGPVICALTAMKIVRELRPNMKKRIRLVMGCNEETGSRCLKHYVEKEGHIDYGFTPDGSFPGVFGEKGHMSLRISSSTNIKRMEAGVAPNVVPNLCEFEIDQDAFDYSKFEAYINENGLSSEKTVNEHNNWLIRVHGVAAHASLPELGKNAVSYTMMALKAANFEDDLVRFYTTKIGLTTDGSLFGCACHDEYGALTFNVGLARTIEENHVTFVVDCRFPVTMKSAQVCDLVATGEMMHGSYVEVVSRGEPLFFDPNSDLVKMLVSSYQEVTGSKDGAITMGGGTYAKGIHNCIAFGAEFPGVDVHMHDADELLRIEDMLKTTEIYVHALLKLVDYEK